MSTRSNQDEIKSGLFVDDAALYGCDNRMASLVDKFNSAFKSIHKWSLTNSVIFDPVKFNILDLTKGRASRSSRSLYFGRKKQSFVPTATYLGLKIDRNFNFKKLIISRFKAAKSQGYRLFNHANRRTGSNPRTLLNILQCYILSVLQYSACTWIFRVRSFTTLGSTSNKGYIEIWRDIERFYHKCIKAALGLQDSTSNIATLVISGLWPLDYRLAFQAAIWYYKICNNLAGAALHKQFQTLNNSQLWNSTLFYQPSCNFINQMSHSGENLTTLPSLREFRTTLSARIQEKLNLIWNQSNKGAWTRQLIPTWTRSPLTSRMFSKPGSVRQLQMISGHFQCNSFRHRSLQVASPLCRHGCDCEEDITHILEVCPHYSTHRTTLRSTLSSLGLEQPIKNLLTNEKATIPIQKFLTHIEIGG